MMKRIGFYIGIVVVLIIGGSLLIIKGKDAVSHAESRKQGILEAEQTTIFYRDTPGAIVKIDTAIGNFVKQGDVLFKVKLAKGDKVDILAPNDGLISKISVEPGDQLQQGVPVAVLQKKTFYTELYIQESEINRFEINQSIGVHFPYLDSPIRADGVVTSVSAAPQFASLRMTRERGQADLSMFLIRISIDSSEDLLPGMTAEVKLDELTD
ncbi:HlyD family efflux transporter periplasmic adaptor subunit [Metabacillus fastidiosus]|uniref:HlyD family efflux transporter periplasmic adaptor subunit n=1 Tax=Metabacillus fastidiosus TaxID=1458 RepID=UPI003D27D9E4